MGRTKTQRETRDFLMALVIKTHQKNNKKHRNFFGRDQNLSIYFGGGPVFFIFYSLNFFFLGNVGGGGGGGGPWPQPVPPSLRL
jgi:hypothetical protein